MGYSVAKPESEFPEFVVRYETISNFFSPQLAKSTFHDLVNKGKIRRMKGMKGFYLLNESLRRMGLKEVSRLPKEVPQRSLQDTARLAFWMIDPMLFPAPPWLLHVEVIDPVTIDHTNRMIAQHEDKVAAYDHPALKIQYFLGALDAQFLLDEGA